VGGQPHCLDTGLVEDLSKCSGSDVQEVLSREDWSAEHRVPGLLDPKRSFTGCASHVSRHSARFAVHSSEIPRAKSGPWGTHPFAAALISATVLYGNHRQYDRAEPVSHASWRSCRYQQEARNGLGMPHLWLGSH
jgi:hypothetical protein